MGLYLAKGDGMWYIYRQDFEEGKCNGKYDSSWESPPPEALEAESLILKKKEKEKEQGCEVSEVVGDYYGRESNLQGTLE